MKCPKCDAENTQDSQFCKKCATSLTGAEKAQPLPTQTIETPREELTTGSTFAGRYQIIEELGKGGMGKVYKAVDTRINEKIALKLIKPEIASDIKTLERFGNELKLARKIAHKNVGKMFDINEEQGTHYITMEYISGQDLKGLIRQTGQLAIGTSISIAKQICEGLAEAHKLGVVHRDLKPNNIMIDREGNVRIMDFGIARSLKEKGITGAGVIIGTPEYMSPEQAEAKDVDQRSDIYSLGVILYEMLTGRRPFEGDTPLSIAMKHKSEIPRSPKELNPQVPEALEFLILRCLDKNQENRFQTSEMLLEQLEKFNKSTTKPDARTIADKPVSKISSELSGKKKLVLFVGGCVALACIIFVSIFFLFPKKPSASPQLGSPVPITTSAFMEDYPSFSPDARNLVYESNQSGNWDIWRTNIISGQSKNLSESYAGDDMCPSWSPDGSQIAFLSDREGGGCFVMSELGEGVQKVSSIGDYSLGLCKSQPRWSGDSRRLALVDISPHPISTIRIIDLENGSEQEISNPGPNLMIYEHAWSTDEKFMAYVDTLHPDTDVSQVWSIHLSDGEGFPITDTNYKYNNPIWAQDGKSIFFISNRGGVSDLWHQGIDSKGYPLGDPQSISTGLELRHFCLSSDGSKLAYASGREQSMVWRIQILRDRLSSWKDAERLTDEQIYNGQAEVSLDGKTLLFDRRVRGIRALWMMELESGEMQQLTSGRPRENVCGRLSRDGKKVVYHVPGLTNVNIWALSVEDRKPWQVTDEEGWNSNPCWSPDGQHIAFTSSRSGNMDVWIVPEKGGQARQLTKDPANDLTAIWSPDGNYILFYSNRNGNGQIWKIPSEGGNPVPVIESATSYSATWSLDGKDIYFVRDSNIWRISAEGGSEYPITDLRDKPGNIEFAPSTDGQYIYFVWREGSGDVWMMDVNNNKKK